MNKRYPGVLCPLVLLLIAAELGDAAEPRVADTRYKLELVAEQPQIVTPIGMAFDRKGRLFVIESHTHQRPKDYKGPASDRIRMLTLSSGGAQSDRWTTFAEGFRHAMNLLVRDDGAVYLVTRRNVVLLRDKDNDAVAEEQKELIRLETKDDYPHNGLSGIALEPGGKALFISMGENHGMSYRLIGSDGKELSGTDGAGSVFQCSLDGSKLQRVAIGFWNPFSICTVPDGRIFAVDNDPDASPPCRMVHVVWGGDYGFRYQYGRAGTHPLQAWNGELPGTLPYMTGVGEAPTAIVPYSGRLWVTSWGDHRIERYEPVPRGASYSAKREIIVQGGADFRPTGMAIGPDGNLYFGDWVLRDYPVHGHGRIWRLIVPPNERMAAFPPRSADDVASSDDLKADELAKSNDPFIHSRGVWRLSQRAVANPPELVSLSPRLLLGMLEAERLRGQKQPETLLRQVLKLNPTDLRLYAIRWIADERITSLRDNVAKLLYGPQPSQRYYLAVLGAVDWLDHKPSLRRREIADELLVRELKNEHRSPEIQALALKMLKPDNKFLTIDRLRAYLQSKFVPLRLEAVRSLAQQSNSARVALLAEVANDKSQSDEVRAEAISGLAGVASENRTLLEELAASDNSAIRDEARRVLRLTQLRKGRSEAKPQADDAAAWKKILETKGDAAAGRRLFFNSAAGRCSVCHKYDGRGGNVGPDLTEIGHSASREKIITSILQPSQEIAPDYQAWNLITTDGKNYTALRLPKPGDDGTEDYVDTAGKVFTLPSTAIEDRHVSSTSIMPDNLQQVLSIDDLRDLVTFLGTPPPQSTIP
jgi:putative membrane-bound dehydrogenase-like protein